MGYTHREVRVIVKDPDTDPRIVCKPDPLMLNKINGPVCITFKLVTLGFRFLDTAEESIRFEGEHEIFLDFNRESDKKVTVIDENGDHRWYLYEVSVLRDDNLTFTTDPLIINK